MTNERPVVTVPRKGTAHRVKATKITKQYIPTTTTTTTTTSTAATTTSTIPTTTTKTTTTTTVSTDTTTAAFKNSSFSPRMEANKILMKTPAKRAKNYVKNNHSKHDISEMRELPMRQTAVDDTKHNLANLRKADDHLLLLCILTVLKGSHIAFV